MLRLIAAAALALATTIPAMAQDWTSNQVGRFTYHSGTDSNGGGWNGTSQQIGRFRYDSFHGPNGQSQNCTSQQIGRQVYTSCY